VRIRSWERICNPLRLASTSFGRFKIRYSTVHEAIPLLPSKHQHDSSRSMGCTSPRCARARCPLCQTAFTRGSADTAGRKVHRLRGAFRRRQIQTQDENKRSHFPYRLRSTGTVTSAVRIRLVFSHARALDRNDVANSSATIAHYCSLWDSASYQRWHSQLGYPKAGWEVASGMITRGRPSH